MQRNGSSWQTNSAHLLNQLKTEIPPPNIIKVQFLQIMNAVHAWLKPTSLAYIPGKVRSPLAERFIESLLIAFGDMGHRLQDTPDDYTDLLVTIAPFDQPVSWRVAPLFSGRVRYKYHHNPTVFTVITVSPKEFDEKLAYFEEALRKNPPDPADYAFPGLAADAYKVLHEQGRRGGPILALERLLQARSKCINVLLLVGEHEPVSVYHFDLVGAYAHTPVHGNPNYLVEIVRRMVTRVSTHEITDHQVVGEMIPASQWQSASAPAAMLDAARRLDERGFFTDTVRIYELVNVPAVSDSVSSQYSEGCFSTWDADLNGLVTTITGSARPVSKGSINQDDLAVIVGIRPDGQGALVRHVEGKRNDPPSSEAVEMIGVDSLLPQIELVRAGKPPVPVPVIRSKLHGHRGISGYDPQRVEFVPMDAPYFHYPVTCATEAQARGVMDAFARSEALRDPTDPRQIAFTILPTHGVLIVEKWVRGASPFQCIWEYFDKGYLELDTHVPQGPVTFIERAEKLVLKVPNEKTGIPR